ERYARQEQEHDEAEKSALHAA
ncbi:hypothetical protein N1F67_31545, partial [Pseudomonas aeruginosa]|nr:hypothetical protein [Pseudomonas aeruginosa]